MNPLRWATEHGYVSIDTSVGGVPMCVCAECRAWVSMPDTEAHELWHDRLRFVTKMPLAGVAT